MFLSIQKKYHWKTNGQHGSIPRRYLKLICIHLKNYYEALGVSPKATQADIKSAYYKLSMVYHPDRNQGCKNSSIKFQEITAAYEVLGDYKLRRLYDKGILGNRDDEKTTEDHFKGHSSTVIQKQRPVTTGRTPIYNFDEWSKFHYGESFQRRNEAKAEYESHKQYREEAANMARKNNIAFTVVLFFVLCTLMSVAFENHDRPKSFKKN